MRIVDAAGAVALSARGQLESARLLLGAAALFCHSAVTLTASKTRKAGSLAINIERARR